MARIPMGRSLPGVQHVDTGVKMPGLPANFGMDRAESIGILGEGIERSTAILSDAFGEFGAKLQANNDELTMREMEDDYSKRMIDYQAWCTENPGQYQEFEEKFRKVGIEWKEAQAEQLKKLSPDARKRFDAEHRRTELSGYGNMKRTWAQAAVTDQFNRGKELIRSYQERGDFANSDYQITLMTNGGLISKDVADTWREAGRRVQQNVEVKKALEGGDYSVLDRMDDYGSLTVDEKRELKRYGRALQSQTNAEALNDFADSLENGGRLPTLESLESAFRDAGDTSESAIELYRGKREILRKVTHARNAEDLAFRKAEQTRMLEDGIFGSEDFDAMEKALKEEFRGRDMQDSDVVESYNVRRNEIVRKRNLFEARSAESKKIWEERNAVAKEQQTTMIENGIIDFKFAEHVNDRTLQYNRMKARILEEFADDRTTRDRILGTLDKAYQSKVSAGKEGVLASAGWQLAEGILNANVGMFTAKRGDEGDPEALMNDAQMKVYMMGWCERNPNATAEQIRNEIQEKKNELAKTKVNELVKYWGNTQESLNMKLSYGYYCYQYLRGWMMRPDASDPTKPENWVKVDDAEHGQKAWTKFLKNLAYTDKE